MRNKDLGILIFRLTIGILMLLHGIAKIKNGVGGIANTLEAQNIPGFIAYGVYVGEVIAPLLIIAGYRTRLGALLLLINMLVIFFIFHPDDIFQLTKNGAWAMELAGFYLFGSLALLFTGSGSYAMSSKHKWD